MPEITNEQQRGGDDPNPHLDKFERELETAGAAQDSTTEPRRLPYSFVRFPIAPYGHNY